MILEIFIILGLILLNGLFSMSEIAVISARRIRLEQLADQGRKAARRALELANEPNNFLSTIQIGITAIGILTGVFGGAGLKDALGHRLNQIPALEGYGEGIGIVTVVLSITFLTLILGELVPKRIAMSNPEAISISVAPLMQRVALVARPAVWLLGQTTSGVLRLLQIRQAQEQSITEEEIKALIAQGTMEGTFLPMEKKIVERVFLLGDRRVSSIMLPRLEITFLNLHDSTEAHKSKLRKGLHTYFPVCNGNIDNVVGVVRSKDLLLNYLEGKTSLDSILRKPLFVPETTRVYTLLSMLQEAGVTMALVVDEFGSVQGMVTLIDIFRSLIGEMGDMDYPEDILRQREDGSWLVDGTYSFDEFCARTGFRLEDDTDTSVYSTLAGFVLYHLQRLPQAGDAIDIAGFRFEVVDMDGNRVDKLLVSPPARLDPPTESGNTA